MHRAVQAAEDKHRRGEPPGQLGGALVHEPQHPEQQHPDQRDAEVQEELFRVVHHADLPAAVVGLGGHQGEGTVGQQHRQRGAQALFQVHLVLMLQPVDGHRAHDEHRHVVPAGVVAGVHGVEHGVQPRHQRHHQAGAENPFEGSALFAPAIGQHAHHAHQGQVGGHAGPLNDAGIEDHRHIGAVRREEEAVKNGGVLLHIAIEQQAEAVGKAGHPGVVLQTEHGGDGQNGPHAHARQALEGQRAEGATANFIPPGQHHADKVDGQEHHLTGEEEVVVE